MQFWGRVMSAEKDHGSGLISSIPANVRSAERRYAGICFPVRNASLRYAGRTSDSVRDAVCSSAYAASVRYRMNAFTRR